MLSPPGGPRCIAGRPVAAIGLGCMSLSHGYGPPPADDDGERLLHRAIDIGYDFFDTAALYGMGHNETLVGRVLRGRRDKVLLASKCGIVVTEDGRRALDGSPAGIAAVLDASLARLGVDHIDLYYLHRLDPRVPIEESVGALADAVTAGKIGAIGLSEISATTLRRAHAVHPIAAVQSEYSLWTRNPEIAVLAACHDLGVTFVPFSPVGRGFLADPGLDPAMFGKGDMRAHMPRFRDADLAANRALLPAYLALATEAGCTPAQLALAWLLHVDPACVPIPGTASIAHMEENFAARDVTLTADVLARTGALINRHSVAGERYPPAMQAQVETEEFA
jgi:aryl-alcohol dehydrogenase-like predicted oxidoreductase